MEHTEEQTYQHKALDLLRADAQKIEQLIKVQMDKYGGNDLRMFIAQQLSHGRWLHPFQALDA